MRGKKIKAICCNCKKEFYVLLLKQKTGGGKYCSKNCYQDYRKRNAIDLKILRKRHQIKFHYGLNEKDIAAMLQEQDNKCAICKCNISAKFYIDHNHLNKKIRGLLCNKCNLALGLVKDNIIVLNSMIAYLQKG